MATEQPSALAISPDQQKQVLAEMITEQSPRLKNRSTEIADALMNSVNSRDEQLAKLKELGVNGELPQIEAMHGKLRQEIDVQKKVDETWAQKGWRLTKETLNTVATPFKWAYNTARKHPVLTALAIAGIAVGGFYAWQYWHQIAAALHTAAGSVAGAAREAMQAPSVLPGGTPMPDVLTQTPGGTFDIPTPFPQGFDPSAGIGPSDVLIPTTPAMPQVPPPTP